MVAMKHPQILQLDPTNELVFTGPFHKVVTSFLELRNPSKQHVCFKVKTTAPRRYCVRPNSGIVEPDGKIRIAIMLQPMEGESQSERIKHKFMVQSTMVAEGEEDKGFDQIWNNTRPDQIMDSKLKCTFAETVTKDDTKIDSSFPDVVGPMKLSSTPTASKQASTSVAEQASSSAGKQAASPSQIQQQKHHHQQQQQQQNQSSFLDKGQQRSPQQHQFSTSSLHESFHQSLTDDRKVVLVSLVMLILGVLLGKYII